MTVLEMGCKVSILKGVVVIVKSLGCSGVDGGVVGDLG